MKIKYSTLFRHQMNALVKYLMCEFGFRIAERARNKIMSEIHDIPPFTSKYPLAFYFAGFEIHRISNKKNYIYYTTTADAIHILAIFDTRMSPSAIRETIMQEVRMLLY